MSILCQFLLINSLNYWLIGKLQGGFYSPNLHLSSSSNIFITCLCLTSQDFYLACAYKEGALKGGSSMKDWINGTSFSPGGDKLEFSDHLLWYSLAKKHLVTRFKSWSDISFNTLSDRYNTSISGGIWKNNLKENIEWYHTYLWSWSAVKYLLVRTGPTIIWNLIWELLFWPFIFKHLPGSPACVLSGGRLKYLLLEFRLFFVTCLCI